MNTVLVIEDDAIMGESLVQRFELEGLRVHWCRRLAEARELLDRHPSAIVSDVRLPDGLAVLSAALYPAAQPLTAQGPQ